MGGRTRNEKKDANAHKALIKRQAARRLIEEREEKKSLGLLN